jgi:hypothetical protein
MQINDTHLKNKFTFHGGTCRHCGREILPGQLRGTTTGRRRQFCSRACQQAEFRHTQKAGGHLSPTRVTKGPSSAKSSDSALAISRTYKDDFSGRLTPEVWRSIIDAERPWLRRGVGVVSSGGGVSFVVGKLRRARR